MRILDRQRFWDYLKAYFVCFVSLVGLWVVIDLFSNYDEFLKRGSGLELLPVIGRYYLVRFSEFYDRLCGVIGMMAAIFAVTWMQKNNELIAMLAAGIGTKRVIRPILISAVLVNGLAVANQEWIIPRIGDELQRDHADEGSHAVLAYNRRDLRDVEVGGKEGDRATQTVKGFQVNFPVELAGTVGWAEAQEARYVPETDTRSPLRGGWVLRGAVLNLPDTAPVGAVLTWLCPEDLKEFPPPRAPGAALTEGDAYFLKTNLTFKTITRKRQWYQYASTPDLIRGLFDPANRPERADMAIFLHGRVLRPLLSLALLCLSLPIVLGGDGRNTFVNLGLSLGTSGLFYALIFVSQYLAKNSAIGPELSAWGPLMIFAVLAAARWDTIRT